MPKGQAKKRVWKTFQINRNRVDEELNKISGEGRTVFQIFQSANVMGTFEVLTYTEE
jgi:hypothetical protein